MHIRKTHRQVYFFSSKHMLSKIRIASVKYNGEIYLTMCATI